MMKSTLLVCILLLVTCVLQSAEGANGAVEQSLEQLRAANQARQTLAKETQEWANEKQRLEVLIAEAERQIKQQEASVVRNKTAIDQLHKSIANLNNQAHDKAEIDAVLWDLSKFIQQSLEERALKFPSGSIQRVEHEAYAEANMHMLRSAAQMKQALASGKQWRAALSSGSLNGKTIAYEQISMGHVAAWWLSRDQSKGGIVERTDGQNVLHEIKDPAVVEAIKSALAIIHGDRAPQLLLLPIDKRQLSTTKKSAP